MARAKPIKIKNYGLNKRPINKELNNDMFKINHNGNMVKAKRLILKHGVDYGVFDDGLIYRLYDIEQKKTLPLDQNKIQSVLNNSDTILKNTMF